MKKFLVATGIATLPMLAFAQTDVSSLSALYSTFVLWSSRIVPIILALMFIYFVWNMFQFVTQGAGAKKDEIQKTIITTVIIFFVVLCFWGLVGFLKNSLNLSSGTVSTQGIGVDLTQIH